MSEIESIELGRLVEHGDNPNRMSRENFRKLVGHIERSGRYEPLVVRRIGDEGGYQILNGHHRFRALGELGYERADCVVWDVSDEEADVLLLSLNRLGGSDILGKKVEILRRLGERIGVRELAGLLPESAKGIERLIDIYNGGVRVEVEGEREVYAEVFFVEKDEQRLLERALLLAGGDGSSRALRRAAGLLKLVRGFIESFESGRAICEREN